MGDGGELVGRQVGRGRGGGRHRVQVPGLDRVGRDHGGTPDHRHDVVAPRAAVDPGGRAVGQHDVARDRLAAGRAADATAAARAVTARAVAVLVLEDRGAGLGGLAPPPPDRLAAAPGVVGVGPHEEVEAVVGEVEVGGQGGRVVAGPVGPDRARGADLGGVDTEGDDDGAAPRPVVVEGVDHVAPPVGLGVEGVDDGAVDGDDRRGGPRRRHRVAHVDDDAPAEAGWARCAHCGEGSGAL